MSLTCEILAIPGPDLILRQRWRFAAVHRVAGLTLVFGESEPFWSSSGGVVKGEREQVAQRGLLHELVQQGWQPSGEGEGGSEWYSVRLNLSRPVVPGEAQLIEAHDHWILPIEGYKVAPCEDAPSPEQSDDLCYDFEGAEEGWRLRLSDPFTYRDADGRVWIVGPNDTGSAYAPMRAAFGATVERAVAHESGRLDLAFADGSALSAEPDPDYEAWIVWGPRNILLVSMPVGGGLAVWSGR